MAQWIECLLANQRVAGSMPSQGTRLGCGPAPQLGRARDNQSMDLSHIAVNETYCTKRPKAVTLHTIKMTFHTHNNINFLLKIHTQEI